MQTCASEQDSRHCFCRSLHIPAFKSKLQLQRDVEVAGTTSPVKCSTETSSLCCLPGTAFSLALPAAAPVACQRSGSSHCSPHTFTTRVCLGPSLRKWKQRVCLHLQFSESNSSGSPKGSKVVLGSQRGASVGNQPSDHHQAGSESSHLKTEKEALSPGAAP